jgi:hypothetical protein
MDSLTLPSSTVALNNCIDGASSSGVRVIEPELAPDFLPFGWTSS